ncbi:MAG: hypothetical protein M1343_10455 [Chloroflexi bacterium]|nr:hypothetical protein [Chloroflexota bacterium]
MKGIFVRKGRRSPNVENGPNRVNQPRLWSTRSRSWMPFEEALDELVLLGDGALAAAVEVAPVDTALMSREEMQGHLARYWQGLRTIHFPVSVYVGTRRQEVADYLQVVTRRLDGMAEARGQQQGFFGMLLEEQCRLLQVLLAEHLRSRCSLILVSHNPNGGLKGAARWVAGERHKVPISTERLREANDDLELKLKKVEDVLRHVGLKYKRCSGRRLAVEIQRLGRPDLMAEDVARLEANLELPTVVRAPKPFQEPSVSEQGNLEEGESYEMAFSAQGQDLAAG